MRTWNLTIKCYGDHRIENGQRVRYEAAMVWTQSHHTVRARSKQDAVVQAKQIAQTEHPTLIYGGVTVSEA